MTGQSTEAKRVADDGAWRVLYGAVCRDRHVDAAHRHVLCTPDMIFTSCGRLGDHRVRPAMVRIARVRFPGGSRATAQAAAAAAAAAATTTATLTATVYCAICTCPTVAR